MSECFFANPLRTGKSVGSVPSGATGPQIATAAAEEGAVSAVRYPLSQVWVACALQRQRNEAPASLGRGSQPDSAVRI